MGPPPAMDVINARSPWGGRWIWDRELVRPDAVPALPTYATVADVLEKKNGSGIRLAGWTVARTAMIAPPFMLVGVPFWQALAGAAISSILISIFTLIRIADAAHPNGVVSVGAERGRYRRPDPTVDRHHYRMSSGRGTYR